MKQFLSTILLLGLAWTVTAATTTNRVIIERDSTATDGYTVDAAKVQTMIANGIKALTGQTIDATAWSQFASSNDVVGIKINTQAAPLHTTHAAVVTAIATGLRAAGVAATNIIIWGHDAQQARDAIPADANSPFHITGIIGGTGWDPQTFFDSRTAGKLVWGDLFFGRPGAEISGRSHLPKLLTQTITKLINVPVLMDHDACGLDGCLYNISLDAIDNSRRFELMGQRGDPTIAEICALPAVRSKLVLNILDALTGAYAGGPSFKPRYSWPAAALYFSRDPVAVDTLALETLEAKRRDAKIPPIGEAASHIATAAALGLGQNNRAQITVEER